MGQTMIILEPKNTRSLHRMESRISNALAFLYFILSLKNNQTKLQTEVFQLLETIMHQFQSWVETQKEEHGIRLTHDYCEFDDLYHAELNIRPNATRHHFLYFTGKTFMKVVRQKYRDIEGMCRLMGINMHTKNRIVQEYGGAIRRVEYLENSKVVHEERYR